mmetsp:Transcript_4690/g.9658  ORF Transcript_4690/g.9658 Transcript_4690/m.9658 type:complete len:738 (+) Transcript_4690:151-2364(+)
MTNDMDPPRSRPRCPSTEGMRELDIFDKPFAVVGSSSASSHAIQEGSHDGTNNPYDHGSSYDEGDDSGDSDCDHDSDNDDHIFHDDVSAPQRTVHLLGQTFHIPLPPPATTPSSSINVISITNFNSNSLPSAIRRFQKQLYWFTYRNELVVPLRPVGLSTDAGWGCMLRSAQMMMAQAVRVHFSHACIKNTVGSSGGIEDAGKRDGNTGDDRRELFERQDAQEVERIANWFADFPNHADIDMDLEVGCGFESGSKPGCNGGGVASRERDNDACQNSKDFSTNQQHSSLHSDSNESYPHNFQADGGIPYHWYSLHQMAAAGLGLGVLPGEWYGPTTACHVLRELNELHVAFRESLLERYWRRENHESGFKVDMFRVHLATEGCVYVDAINQLMTRNKKCNERNETSSCDAANGEGTHATSSTETTDCMLQHQSLKEDVIDDPLRMFHSPEVNSSNKSTKNRINRNPEKSSFFIDPSIEWDTSLLILLPLRLGLQSIPTDSYGSTLAKLLSFSQSVGMLGGTPRHALWFYGADDVGPNATECGGLYGLDPHVTQPAPRGTRVLFSPSGRTCNENGVSSDDKDNDSATKRYRWQVQPTETYLRSLHTSPTTNSHSNHHKPILLSKLDPSCALGFYFRDYPDFCDFRRELDKLTKEHCRPNKLPEIVTVMEKTPNYDADVSAAMKDMMLGGKSKICRGNDIGEGDCANLEDLDGFSIQSAEDKKDELMSDGDDDDDDYVLL